MNTKRIALFAGLAATGLALSACSGGSDEPPAPTTNVEEVAPIENEANVPTEAPPATRIDNSMSEGVPTPAPTLTSDEQTQDDADATGMTARVSRDEAGNDTGQPAQ